VIFERQPSRTTVITSPEARHFEDALFDRPGRG
jgi:hypothetical protein